MREDIDSMDSVHCVMRYPVAVVQSDDATSPRMASDTLRLGHAATSIRAPTVGQVVYLSYGRQAWLAESGDQLQSA